MNWICALKQVQQSLSIATNRLLAECYVVVQAKQLLTWNSAQMFRKENMQEYKGQLKPAQTWLEPYTGMLDS